MASISKNGYGYNGKQIWMLWIDGKGKVKNSIDKHYLEFLLDEYNNGHMSIDDIKKHKRLRYTSNIAYISKAGKLNNGAQAWCIRINTKVIRTYKDKNFLEILIDKYNNNEINLQQLKEYHICQYCGNVFYSKEKRQKYCNSECKKKDYKKYYQKSKEKKEKKEKKYQQYSVLQLLKPRAKVGLGGLSNGKQAYRLTWNSQLIRRSIDKKFLDDLACKLNNYEITFEEAKNQKHSLQIKNRFNKNNNSPVFNVDDMTLDELYNRSSVYYILNLINFKIYIGASRRTGERFNAEHIRQLNHGNHENPYLQRAWKKYGSGNFEFGIIQFCNKKEIFDLEEFWVQLLQADNPKYGYNLTPGGDNPPIRYGEDNNKYRADVHNDSNYICKMYKEGLSIKEISEKYNTVHSVIIKILKENNLKIRSHGEQMIVEIVKRNNLFKIDNFCDIDFNIIPRIIHGTTSSTNKKTYVLKIGINDPIVISSWCLSFIEDCAIKFFNNEYDFEDLKHIKKTNVRNFYTLWPMHKINYKKYKHNYLNDVTDPCQCFFVKYLGKNILKTGFLDFYTPILIHDLAREYSK